MVEHKIGQRHVQGRTKAGGRASNGSPAAVTTRRGRPTRPRPTTQRASLGGVRLVVTGGDHGAVDAVLEGPRLSSATVVGPWLPVPDPRRAVLDQAIADAQAIGVEVTNA